MKSLRTVSLDKLQNTKGRLQDDATRGAQEEARQ